MSQICSTAALASAAGKARIHTRMTVIWHYCHKPRFMPEVLKRCRVRTHPQALEDLEQSVMKAQEVLGSIVGLTSTGLPRPHSTWCLGQLPRHTSQQTYSSMLVSPAAGRPCPHHNWAYKKIEDCMGQCFSCTLHGRQRTAAYRANLSECTSTAAHHPGSH